MPTDLSIAAATFEGIDVLKVSGDLDLSTAGRFGRALAAARGPGAPLIADLTGIDFFDSAGTHALLDAERAAAAEGTRLLILPSPAVSRVLRLTGLHSLFHLFPGPREAAAGLSTAADLDRLG